MIITLTGMNDFLIKQTCDKLAADFVEKAGEHSVERVDGEALAPDRLPDLLQSGSLFAAERLIILTGAAKNKPVWDALSSWLERIADGTTLLLIESELDKRTKTYKILAKLGELRILGPLSEKELNVWLQTSAKNLGGDLDAKASAYLTQQAGADQWRLWQELQKLVNYSPKITRATIDAVVEPNPQASVFELLDAALAGNIDQARQILHKLSSSEDVYKLFGLLVSQIHALAVIKAAKQRSADVIAKEAGLHPFVVRKTVTVSARLNQSQLQAIIQAVATCDTQLKSTGADPWLLLEQCLQKIAIQTVNC